MPGTASTGVSSLSDPVGEVPAVGCDGVDELPSPVDGEMEQALKLFDESIDVFAVCSCNLFSELEYLAVSDPIWREVQSMGAVGWSSVGVSDEPIKPGGGGGHGTFPEGPSFAWSLEFASLWLGSLESVLLISSFFLFASALRLSLLGIMPL
jgi:hypothetical protein